MATLRLPPPVRAELETAARAGYPHEVCGLLIGARDGDDCRVDAMRAARNLNRERARDRYELDPADYLAAETDARAAGREIVGVWHTHPDHPAAPSETDRAAAWEGWSYLILSVARDGVRELASWRLAGSAFEREEIAS